MVMSYWQGKALLLLLQPYFSWSQVLKRDPPLPYKDCDPPSLFIAETDSIRQRAVIDSTVPLVAGHWQLVEEEAGACFVAAHAPAQHTEVTIDRQGQGITYINGQPVNKFQLLFSFYYGRVHFVMNQTSGQPYFDFLPPYKSRNKRHYNPKFEGAYRNVLRVCEETLIMTGPRTGLSYVFRRVPFEYGPQE